MANAALKGALGNLASLAGTELGLLLGFNGDRERLESMLNAIKATLEDAEEKQFSDRATKVWLGKLKDAAYELDDILKDYAYEELRLEYEEVKCCVSEIVLSSSLSSFHPVHLYFCYKIARRMKRISERLDQIAKEKDQLRLASTVQGETGGVPEWRQTMSSVSEPQVFGREEDTKNIVDFLIGNADVSRSENLSVYPIIGLGGIGKTTLARHIFHHERVVNHFGLKCWVCVSEDFSLSRIMEAIIEAASGQDCRGSNLEALQRKLQDQLRGKKCLIVLDDVWDNDNWARLKSVLAYGAKGSSILVTTRDSRVAESMGSTPHPHKLEKLSDNDCWELFKNQAFKTNEEEQAELEVIGRKIVKKCKGVPLAAKAVRGILRFKRNTNQWHNVLESNLLELSDNQDSIMSVLRLSYLNLPIELRQCFAFCAIFPKDAQIRKQHLIELWMAIGFISSNAMLDAEEVGDEVWDELHRRSFFQDIEKDEFGKIRSFKMHDLFHDFAQLVAEDVYCITGDNGVATLPERIHHVSNCSLLWISFEEANSIQHRVRSLRTYICPDLYYFPVADQFSSHVLKCYSLRVLDFVHQEQLPSLIGDLKHLRYLNLSWGSFETLPESLCKLWNLQILKLNYCARLQKLPNSLIRLKALQQLSLNGCSGLSSLPPHIGKLTSLRILSKYFVGNEGGFLLAELGPLKLKGDLHIKHMKKVKSVSDAEEANMSSKQLNKLCLSWDRNEEEWELQEDDEEILEGLQPNTQQLRSLEVEGYKGVHFPQWMSSPSLKYLSHLVLQNCKSSQLPALDKLPSLKCLEICNMTNVKYIYKECYDGREVFKALESLTLMLLPNLIRLSKEDGENMFPCLSELVIAECPRFLEEEVLLQGLHSLKKLSIYGCNKFNVSASSQCLTCIEALLIDECREVEGLQVLQHMTALKELDLQNLPKLESLPDCFGNLPLLHKLEISSCFKLTCLPASVSRSNLKKLHIGGCPELEERCVKETGEDWQKIAHIPRISVGDHYYSN